jgi:hypothetical protein
MSHFNTYVYEIEEFLTTNNHENMMHIMGVSLNDANTTAHRNELASYLNAYHTYEETKYQVSMVQNIIVIGENDF